VRLPAAGRGENAAAAGSIAAVRTATRIVFCCLPALLVAGAAVAAAGGGPGAGASAARPPIVKWLIPFGPKRKREMAAYSERHYGEHTWRLVHPKVIVEHMSEAGSAAAVRNTFAPDVPDVELHELPNVCSHFVVAASGRIFELVNLRTRCRHTVGLNWTAIGIEHVGYADSDALNDPAQMQASLRLTQWLRCKFHIEVKNVIGHNESLSSPYHRENVPSLRNQTHGDWRHSSMRIYRKRLRALGPC
jgi:N-acetylmuramoyl-L-alanine amidase